MKSAKQQALDLVRQLPDDADAILYHLYVQAKIRRGMEELTRGETFSHQEVMENLERWLSSIGR